MKPQIAYLIFRTRENTGTHVVFDHARALMRLGHTVEIYTLFGTSAAWYPKGLTTKSFFHYLTDKKPDALVATFWPTAYLAFLLPARKKFYLVMGWEEEFHSLQIIKFFARLSYKLPLQKIAVSHNLKKRIESYTKKKNAVLYVMTYIPAFVFPKKKVTKKKSKTPTILSIASWYNRVKGIDLLEHAITQLKKRGKYKAILVSREKESYSPVFDAFYSDPKKEDLQRLYAGADIVLATSRNEGFYIPGIEAMANGCLFITTNSGGINEYVENGKNAIILNKLSDLWKKDILKNALKNTSYRKRMVDSGYKAAEAYRKYTLKHLGRDIEQILLTMSS